MLPANWRALALTQQGTRQTFAERHLLLPYREQESFAACWQGTAFSTQALAALEGKVLNTFCFNASGIYLSELN